MLVIKASGNRQAFDPQKIKNGVIKACEKRPVPMAKIDELVDNVSKQVYNSMEQEGPPTSIDEMVRNETNRLK